MRLKKKGDIFIALGDGAIAEFFNDGKTYLYDCRGRRELTIREYHRDEPDSEWHIPLFAHKELLEGLCSFRKCPESDILAEMEQVPEYIPFMVNRFPMLRLDIVMAIGALPLTVYEKIEREIPRTDDENTAISKLTAVIFGKNISSLRKMIAESPSKLLQLYIYNLLGFSSMDMATVFAAEMPYIMKQYIGTEEENDTFCPQNFIKALIAARGETQAVKDVLKNASELKDTVCMYNQFMRQATEGEKAEMADTLKKSIEDIQDALGDKIYDYNGDNVALIPPSETRYNITCGGVEFHCIYDTLELRQVGRRLRNCLVSEEREHMCLIGLSFIIIGCDAKTNDPIIAIELNGGEELVQVKGFKNARFQKGTKEGDAVAEFIKTANIPICPDGEGPKDVENLL